MNCYQCGRSMKDSKGKVCPACVQQNERDFQELSKLHSQGHTLHCARRIVWGDGECECSMREKM